MFIKGMVTKCVAGVYEIFTENGEYVNCYARGKFRNKKISPLVGDRIIAEISDMQDDDNTIKEIFKRKNQNNKKIYKKL